MDNIQRTIIIIFFKKNATELKSKRCFYGSDIYVLHVIMQQRNYCKEPFIVINWKTGALGKQVGR